ncbi:MAG: DUF3822 family protein, partial [Flavobacterium sp.]
MSSPSESVFTFNSSNPDALISIFNDSSESLRAQNGRLLVTVSETELALALMDKKRNAFLALEVFIKKHEGDQQWLQSATSKSILLKEQAFDSSSVAIVNSFFTVVPSALFQEEDKREYVQFNFNTEDMIIKSDKVSSYEAVNVYALSELMNNNIETFFKNSITYHHTTPLLAGVQLAYGKFNRKTITVNVRPGSIDVVVTEGRKLILINSFFYKAIDDVLYYILFVADRLQLNPSNIHLVLTGQV